MPNKFFHDLKNRFERKRISQIMNASQQGNIDKVSYLLKKHPALVNAKSDKMETPLHRASLYGQHEIVDFLLRQGADVNAKSESGSTPLEQCYIELHREVATDWYIPISIGRNTAHYMEVAALLLKWGADPNQILPIACNNLDKSMVELLLKNRANVNIAFWNVVWSFHKDPDKAEEILSIVLTLGASIDGSETISDARYIYGDGKGSHYSGTALHYAVTLSPFTGIWPNFRLLSFLVSKGANTNAKDNYGCTALEQVEKRISEIEREQKESLDKIDSVGYAIAYENLMQIAKFLKQATAQK